MNAEVVLQLVTALNTLLQFARDNGVSSRRLLDEYLSAKAEGRTLTAADIEGVKREAREALDKLAASLPKG